jgi:site-specific DNA-methyltransferase (adenine-specific)
VGEEMTHSRSADASKTAKDEQRTPMSLFNRLSERFLFTIDIAATEGNQLMPIYMSDFLNPKCSLWEHDVAFCNPPYSRGIIDKFVTKAYQESLKGATVVCLLPADVSTKWFRTCMAADEWIVIEGRVRFNHADGTPIKGSPKFGSIVVVFKNTERRRNLGFPVISSMGWR